MNTRQNASGVADGGSLQADVFDNFGIDPNTDFNNDDDTGDLDLGQEDDLGVDDDDLGAPDPRQAELEDLGRVTQTRQPQQRQQRQQQQPDPNLRQLAPKAAVRADAKGNLINAAGQIVAKAGKEARLYQQARQADTQIQGLRSHVTNVEGRLGKALKIANDLVTENEQFKAREQQIQKFGLSSEEHLEALTLYSQNKQNPVQFLRNLLTRAAARGININEVVQGGGNNNPAGFDAAALATILKNSLNEGLAPVRTLAEQQQNQINQRTKDEEAVAKTRETVQDFFNINTAARPYMRVFQQVLSDPQTAHMSLDEIWLRIQLNQARNGNRSLSRLPQQNPPRRRAMPQGRSGPGARQGAADNTDQVASVNDSYDTILKGVLADHNM